MNTISCRAAARRTTATAIVIAALAGVSCVTVGEDFPVDPVHTLRIGETTREQVRERLGEPWRTGLEDGQRTWTYGLYRYSLFGSTRTRDLVVRFDDAGTVASYSFSSSFPEDRAR